MAIFPSFDDSPQIQFERGGMARMVLGFFFMKPPADEVPRTEFGSVSGNLGIDSVSAYPQKMRFMT